MLHLINGLLPETRAFTNDYLINLSVIFSIKCYQTSKFSQEVSKSKTWKQTSINCFFCTTTGKKHLVFL